MKKQFLILSAMVLGAMIVLQLSPFKLMAQQSATASQPAVKNTGLSFRIAPFPPRTGNGDNASVTISSEELDAAVKSLEKGGPEELTKKGGKLQWFKIKNEEKEFNDIIVKKYEDAHFLLLYNQPGNMLLQGSGEDAWSVHATKEFYVSGGMPSINFVMGARGAKKMNELTRNHMGHLMAILIDDEVYVAPTIRTVISESCAISGRFTNAQVDELVKKINDASPKPPPLPSQPEVGIQGAPVELEDVLVSAIKAGVVGDTEKTYPGLKDAAIAWAKQWDGFSKKKPGAKESSRQTELTAMVQPDTELARYLNLWNRSMNVLRPPERHYPVGTFDNIGSKLPEKQVYAIFTSGDGSLLMARFIKERIPQASEEKWNNWDFSPLAGAARLGAAVAVVQDFLEAQKNGKSIDGFFSKNDFKWTWGKPAKWVFISQLWQNKDMGFFPLINELASNSKFKAKFAVWVREDDEKNLGLEIFLERDPKKKNYLGWRIDKIVKSNDPEPESGEAGKIPATSTSKPAEENKKPAGSREGKEPLPIPNINLND